jgi:hypothetical protein
MELSEVGHPECGDSGFFVVVVGADVHGGHAGREDHGPEQQDDDDVVNKCLRGRGWCGRPSDCFIGA